MAMRSAVALAMSALTLAGPMHAQQPSPEHRRAFVDATASTGAGVFDLKPEEFEVREGGERRDVSSVTLTRRPARVVLIVDNTEYLRQQIGQVRTALVDFVDALDPEHEMMLLTVAGTMQIRVRPTTDRKPIRDAISNLFGLNGTNRMHKHIDDALHRFAMTTDHRPVFVVVTAEGFESTQDINPQEISHIAGHFDARGGVLHAIRLTVPLTGQSFRQGQLTEMPVSLMIARDTGGVYVFNSPSGLRDALQRLAGRIDEEQADSPMSYRIEYAGGTVKGKKPAVPDVRTTREGLTLKVIAAP